MDFSIVIPAKNESRYIENCLSTIRRNSQYPEDLYEVIVVDNGSTDETACIAKSLGARVLKKTDGTIAGLRNFGASIASGTFVVFLDADCTVCEGWLKSASRYLVRDDVVCFGAAPLIPENATWVQNAWFLARYRGFEVKETHWLESTNMFVRKEAFWSIHGFDETLITCEDVDLSYRLSSLGKLMSDPDIRIIHHRDPSTIREFFKKEAWRGKSNYTGLFRHGLKLSELPSLMIPLYYGAFFGIFLIANLLGWPGFGILALMLGQLPVVAVTVYKLRSETVGPTRFIQLHLLYNIYYLARFSAIFR